MDSYNFEILSKSPVFRRIETTELEGLLSSVSYQFRQFKKGQMIAQSGEQCDYLLNLVKGSIAAEMIDFSGKTIKIEDINSPNPLAPAFLFGSGNKFPVNIVAIEDVKILFIPKSSFIHLLQSNQNILENYLNVVSNRSQFLSRKIRFLSFKTIKGKIAQYILENTRGNNSEEVHLQKSQNELAILFGVTRPSLARVLKDMEDEGIIEVNRRIISIKNKQKLNELLR